MGRTRSVGAIAALALVLAACGSSSDEADSGGLATLEDEAPVETEETVVEDERSIEEAVLEFADCVRDNGVPDFQDPIVSADGAIEFTGIGPGQGDGVDNDALFEALEACGELLEGVAFGPGATDFDLNEIQDTMLLFAECLRDNGLDVDDPDITAGFGGNQGDDESGGPGLIGPETLFGDRIDFEDPETQEIFETCAEKVNLPGPGGN